MSGARHWEQDQDATVYIGNLDERVSDALVWELMLQAGRIVNVHLPKDRVTQTHQGFGFVEYISEEDADYSARIMNQVRLYGKPIRVNKASADKQRTVEVGAELFVGNLDPMVDEKTLYDTFSSFGNLVSAPKIARDEAGASKCFGFVSYDSFEASDKAIESMDKQFLMNKEISVQYAYKRDGKGERHGDDAERHLAAQGRKHNVQVHTPQLPPGLFNPPPSAPTGPSGFRGPPPSSQPSAAPPITRPPPSGPSGLGAPPPGLPPRPPPPQQFAPPPFGQPVGMPPRPGFPPMQSPQQPPPGFGAPPPQQFPPGFGPPPGQMPPGFAPPAMSPHAPPPGFGGRR